jgi:hypothetical protein
MTRHALELFFLPFYKNFDNSMPCEKEKKLILDKCNSKSFRYHPVAPRNESREQYAF